MVFEPTSRRFEKRDLATRGGDESLIVVRPSLSAICGSDLHTVSGRRNPGGPLVLGHEICGEIEHTGDGPLHDYDGNVLLRGDRVTWSLTSSCGHCFYCRCGLPQKCETVFKYGHATVSDLPSLSGGFAERICLRRGTAVFRVPDDLPDWVAVFANCAMATAVAAVRQAKVISGESVLIQGGGLLGLCTAAVAREAGADRLVVVDALPERRRWAHAFGADEVVEPGEQVNGSRGFDVAFEMCGQPSALEEGLRALRIGGRYLLCGCVFPGAEARIDLDRLTRGCLELVGVHNYTPRDLGRALELMSQTLSRYPFEKVVAAVLPLEEIERAFELAGSQKGYLRVALSNTPMASSPQ